MTHGRTRYGPDWGGSGRAAASVSVRRTRGLTRSDLAQNRATAPIEIDPTDGRVTLPGRPLEILSAGELPMNRRYWLR